jgi:GMP synthase-like glutamine amidotransferase
VGGVRAIAVHVGHSRSGTLGGAMKPVLILQHLHADGPAYLGSWLKREGVPHRVLNAEAGDSFPTDITGHSALAVLGGEMSANDPLPCLREGEHLILCAMRAGVPVLGHCLGGQLMAKALGAPVGASPQPEIGWHAMRLLPCAQTAAWFGNAPAVTVCQWHYDAFDLPEGAQGLAQSEACPWQAFAIGPHLAMQFHIEIDEAKLRAWVSTHDERYLAATARPGVQTASQMLQGMGQHMAASQALADRIYARWISLARGAESLRT